MMQEMWVAGLEWDALCPSELVHKPQEWFCELKDLPTIKVPRCLRFGREQVVLSETSNQYTSYTSFRTDGNNPGTKIDRVGFQNLQWWIGPSIFLVRQYECMVADKRKKSDIQTLCSKPSGRNSKSDESQAVAFRTNQ